MTILLFLRQGLILAKADPKYQENDLELLILLFWSRGMNTVLGSKLKFFLGALKVFI